MKRTENKLQARFFVHSPGQLLPRFVQAAFPAVQLRRRRPTPHSLGLEAVAAYDAVEVRDQRRIGTGLGVRKEELVCLEVDTLLRAEEG